MADATISWDDAHRRGDWTLAGSALLTGNDLDTAILISLFTDRMEAADDVIPDGTGDPRGWWADDDVPIGSRMWLLRRAKKIPKTLSRAFDYLAEALQWLIDDGVVASFDISVQWVQTSVQWAQNGVLGAQIIAYKADGTQLTSGRYSWAWTGIN